MSITTPFESSSAHEAAAVDALWGTGEAIAQVIASARSRDHLRGVTV